MGCNCNITEFIIGAIVIIFALVETMASKWIVFVAGIILVLHSLMCKNCKTCKTEMKVQTVQKTVKKPAKKAKKRR